MSDNDLQNGFLAARAQAQQPDDSWMREAAEQQSAQAQPGDTATSPAATSAAPAAALPHPNLSLGARILNTTGQVASDIGTGLSNIHREVANGLIDTATDINKFSADVANKLPGSSYGVRLFDEQGNFKPSLASDISPEESAQTLGHLVPDKVDQPDSVTGNVIEKAIPFLIGRAGALRRLEQAGVKGAAGELTADAASGALTTTPGDKRISNAIEEFAPNAVSQWLAAPDSGTEDAAMARIKGGLEMAGVGVAAKGVGIALKALKNYITSSSAARQGYSSFVDQGGTAAGEDGAAPAAASEQPTSQDQGATGAAPESGTTQEEGQAPAEAAHQPLPGETPAPTDATEAGAGEETTPATAESSTPGQDNPSAEATPAADAAANSDQPVPGTDGAVAADAGVLPAVAPMDAQSAFAGLDTDVGPSQTAQENAATEARPSANPPDADTIKMGEDYLAERLGGATDSEAPSNNRINTKYVGEAGRPPEDPGAHGNVMEDVGRTLPEHVPVTFEQTRDAATMIGITPQEFLSGKVGSALNSVEMTKLRDTLYGSAAGLVKYAGIASNPETATPLAKAQFMRAFATHRSLQLYAQGAQAEAARTLNAFKIVSQSGAQINSAIENIINGVGENNVDTLIAQMNDLQDPALVSRYVASAAKMTPTDMFLKGFYNTMLGPKTVVRKLGSDVALAAWNVATRYAAETLGQNVPAGETAQLIQGYISSQRDAFALAAKALRAGESQFYTNFQTQDGMSGLRTALIGAGADAPLATPNDAALGFMKSLLPTSWIGAADDYAKYTNYRAELQALAYRDAVTTQGISPNDADGIWSHIQQTLTNVPDAMHAQAKAAALRTTFQDPLGPIMQAGQTIIDGLAVPVPGTNFKLPIGRMAIMPFYKVPVNIAKWSFTNSPLGALFPSMQADLRAGGATRELALAKMGLGTMAYSVLGGLAYAGIINGRGPADKGLNNEWQAAGNQPYSIKIGDRQYGMGIEPFGQMASLVADTANVMKFATDADNENIAGSVAWALGHSLVSRTYMSGLSNFMEAMNDPQAASKWADSLAANLAAPQNLATIDHMTDPFMRAHYGLLDSIEARLPIVSQGLPAQVTRWGDPIPTRDAYLPIFGKGEPLENPVGVGLGQMLSPITMKSAEPENPIDKWIFDNRAAFPRGPDGRIGMQPPSMTQTWAMPGNDKLSASIPLNPAQFVKLKELAGNQAPVNQYGMGAKDTLNALVQGTFPNPGTQASWNKANPAQQALWVQNVYNQGKEAAKALLWRDNPDIRAAAQAQWKVRAQQLTAPTIGAGSIGVQ